MCEERERERERGGDKGVHVIDRARKACGGSRIRGMRSGRENGRMRSSWCADR